MEIPQPLVEDIADGRCLPIIGAGFSLNAQVLSGLHMPDWKGLTAILARSADISENQSGPLVATEFERKFGRVQLIETIRRALLTDSAEPNKAHKAFVQLPFDTIYTTNFDSLLEDAYHLIKRPVRQLSGDLQLPFHGGTLTATVIKMHGDLTHAEHVIVTDADYKSYLKKYPVIATHLSAMLITRTALFIGYSLSDPDFQNIRQIIKSRLGKFLRMAYLIQFDATHDESEERLKDLIHVVSISTQNNETRDSALSRFFTSILNKLDEIEGPVFRAAKPNTFEHLSDNEYRETAKFPDAPAIFGSTSNMCFVVMPFKKELQDIFHNAIVPAVESLGLSAVRADEIAVPGSITEQIRVAIQNARIVIADLSDANPNVLYEVGFAHSINKPTILLSNSIALVPFDIQGLRVLIYDNQSIESGEIEFTLRQTLENVLIVERIQRGSQLIKSKMFTAGIAELSIALETALQAWSQRLDSLPHKNEKGSRNQSMILRRLINKLFDIGHLDKLESENLFKCLNIRSNTIHGVSEPHADEAYFLLSTVDAFVKKHLGVYISYETQ